VKFDPNGRGMNIVLGWRCTCKVGLRTVGCCSHVAAVLIQLGCLNHGADLKDFSRAVQKPTGGDDVGGDSSESEDENESDESGN